MFYLTPFNRRRDLSIQNQRLNLENLVENFFNDAFFPSLYANEGQMKVDIKENEKEFIVEAELPGVNKDDIGVELTEDMLTLSVTRNEQINEETEKYVRRERRYGSMTRSFYVNNIDSEKINAKFENGILTINLPKKTPETKKGGRIQIN